MKILVERVGEILILRSTQTGILEEAYVIAWLTALSIKVISSASDNLVRLWIWFSFSRISWEDGSSLVSLDRLEHCRKMSQEVTLVALTWVLYQG